jgi:hypothetical protein
MIVREINVRSGASRQRIAERHIDDAGPAIPTVTRRGQTMDLYQITRKRLLKNIERE